MANAERVEITSSGIQNSLSRFEPLKSLCEYIWNGFDAQATVVEIEMLPNEMGIASQISIRDNGIGIDRRELKAKFRPIFESEKLTHYDPEIKHSHTKGKNGVGRLTFFKFADLASWKTTYNKDGQSYTYSIFMNRDSLNTYDPTEEIETAEQTGTTVTFDQIFAHDLSNDSILPYIRHEFCWFLELHKAENYSITYNGQKITYDSMIADCGEETFIDCNIEYYIRYVVWNKKLSEYSKYYYLSSDGTEIAKENTKLNNKGDKFYHSLYIRSSLFDNFDFSSEAGKHVQTSMFPCYTKSHLEYKSIMDRINALLYSKRRPYLKKQVDEIVEALDVPSAFPQMQAENLLDQFRLHQISDIAGCLYVAEPKLFSNMNKEQKKTFLRLLDLIMQSGEVESLFSILNEIIEMESEERKELSSILKYTTLSNVTRTIALLKDRYQVIENLKSLVYQKELHANEVNHLQKVIEDHYWMFGEQYNLVTAEEPNFEEALRRYLYYLHKEYEDASIDHPDKLKQMDIFAVRRNIATDSIENIVVELKHPDITLGEKQLSQVKKYMEVIQSKDEFNGNNMYWHFYLIGNRYNNYISNEIANNRIHGERSIVYNVDRCRIYVLTWSQLFGEFEIRYNHLNDKLKLQQEKLQQSFSNADEVVCALKSSSAQMPGELSVPTHA